MRKIGMKENEVNCSACDGYQQPEIEEASQHKVVEILL